MFIKHFTNALISIFSKRKKVSKPSSRLSTTNSGKPQWKKLNTNSPKNIRGLFDSIENCVYFDTGEVIQFRGRFNKRVTNKSDAEIELQKWARFRGLIKSDEYIAVR